MSVAAEPLHQPVGPTSRLRDAMRSRRARTLLMLGAVLVIDLILLVRRAFSSDISPFDEGYHLSYVQYAHEWTIPRSGDPMGSWSEQMYACHPTYPFGQVTGVPCGVDGPSADYPEGGVNTAAAWPPVYYFLVANLIRPLLVLGIEPVYSGRIGSALVWTAGCVLLSALVLRASAGHLLALCAGVLGAAMPASWVLSSFVTPHSTAMLVGALAIAFLVWVYVSDHGVLTVLAASVAFGIGVQLILPQSVVALSAVAVAAVSLVVSRSTRWRQLLAMALALPATAVATYLVWGRVVAARSVGEGLGQPGTPPEGWWAALRDNWAFFWPRGLAEVQFLSGVESAVAALLMYGSVALMGHWLLSTRATVQRALAVGLLVAAPVMSAAFAYLLDFDLPTRYGASAYALALYLLALDSPSRTVRWCIAAITLVTVLISLRSVGHFMVLTP